MVYGRYNELVNGDYFMVYKPTYNWGAPSCCHNPHGNHGSKDCLWVGTAKPPCRHNLVILPKKLRLEPYQWEFQDPKMEVPTICKAYIRAM